MPRKLFNKNQLRRIAAVGAVLLAARGSAHAQETAQAQMWAATARYVYADDPNLKPLVAKLNTALGQPQTLGEFEQKLQAAVAEAAAASKTPNIKVLQRQFQNMRALNAPELLANLPDSLLKTAVRRQGERRDKLAALEKQLMALAQSTSSETAATPTPSATGELTASQVMDMAAAAAAAPVASQPAPTSPLLWVALVMSGLSLAGVIRLLTSRSSRHSSGSTSESGRSSHSGSRELSPEQHREVETMIARALAGRADKPAASTPAPAPKPAPTPPAPAQSVKQKLASNSPKPVRPPVETSSAALPSLASIAGAAPTPTPPAAVPAPPAPEPTPVPDAVEPGTSIELDVTPAAAPLEPAVRLQFVNEAPFNNTFAARTLSDAMASYSIYEVLCNEQTPDQGQFRVVGNMVSHISNHRNILEPVCEYVAYPQGGETRIITEQPGEVRRRGADWEIVRRARIRFE
ncbi:hypothetical protein GO988_06205 [Hymenobacter sp. HMF4947]|uniref:Uncharacterized protein n=1 Tax=Hymenobacter ginkgonis TaxID=2682976 RepID=A0A7K1TC04_9BACT|nr:hypothetical protein [Hymenobacter ginkgonis]MVN75915.1 hypothetical protein [Hymenobacter ginkgonis]